MLSVHWLAIALILAELVPGCSQVLDLHQAQSSLLHYPLPLLGWVAYCILASLKGRQEKAGLIPVATAQLRKHEVFINLSQPFISLSTATR